MQIIIYQIDELGPIHCKYLRDYKQFSGYLSNLHEKPYILNTIIESYLLTKRASYYAILSFFLLLYFN